MSQSGSAARSTRSRGLLGIKDTIESIVVAFVLAFIFRAFVAEAFVIPTGSMAPNLYGMHHMHTCTVCGTEYAYGYSTVPSGGLQPPATLICQNCGHRHEKRDDLTPVNGDRIFVLKWLFDVGRLLPDVDNHGPRQWWHLFKPCRWDVVVFKDPNDGTTNFIKRLIGLPGEVLEIIDGDIYTAKVSELTVSDPGRSLLKKLEVDRAFYEQLTRAEQQALDRALKIQRKTERAQKPLSFLAYDNDFVPVREPELAGWKPVSAGRDVDWDTSGRTLRFTPTREGPLQEIEFARLEPEHPVTDVYAYNGARDSSRFVTPGEGSQIDVSDLRLRCLLIPRGGQGRLALSLSKRDDRFVVTFDRRGEVRLTRSSLSRPNEPPEEIGRADVEPLDPKRPVRLSLSNADYRVSVRVDGRVIIRTSDEQYPALKANGLGGLAEYARRLAPNGNDNVPQIRIGAAGMSLELRHVIIDRDVYYRSPQSARRFAGWGIQGRPIYLRNRPERNDQEYYCLGDNSPLSKDSRLWSTLGPHLVAREAKGEYQLGTVPADQMVGRAFFVYWPAGYPLIQRHLPLVPNVGDMRLIR